MRALGGADLYGMESNMAAPAADRSRSSPPKTNVKTSSTAQCCPLTAHLLTQDGSSGKPVRVGDTDLTGMEIDVAAAAAAAEIQKT